jgi:hypothetical protein
MGMSVKTTAYDAMLITKRHYLQDSQIQNYKVKILRNTRNDEKKKCDETYLVRVIAWTGRALECHKRHGEGYTTVELLPHTLS